MVAKISTYGNSADMAKLEADLRAISGGFDSVIEGKAPKQGGFVEMLGKGIAEVNTAIRSSDKASMDLVSGKSSNLHETMLTVAKAEIGFNMMVQLRNKAIEAYQEVMRMQV